MTESEIMRIKKAVLTRVLHEHPRETLKLTESGSPIEAQNPTGCIPVKAICPPILSIIALMSTAGGVSVPLPNAWCSRSSSVKSGRVVYLRSA